MKLIIIAAVNKKRVIGREGKLPWSIPEDLKRFKELTTGHTILMGRKTFESIGKPLPNRQNVVLSSKRIKGVETYTSLELALDVLHNEDIVFVIGGGEIYSQTLTRANEIFLTIVNNDMDGDTFFPSYEDFIDSHFMLVFEEQHDGYSFKNYKRVN